MNDPERGDLLCVNSSVGSSNAFSTIGTLKWNYMGCIPNGTPVLFLGGLQPWNVKDPVIYIYAAVLLPSGFGWIHVQDLERIL